MSIGKPVKRPVNDVAEVDDFRFILSQNKVRYRCRSPEIGPMSLGDATLQVLKPYFKTALACSRLTSGIIKFRSLWTLA
jgi:hypothetical protein